MRTYELTDAELNNYMYEQDLMKKKNLARYLNGEIADLENLLTKYENQRAELKVQKRVQELLQIKLEIVKSTLNKHKKSLKAL